MTLASALGWLMRSPHRLVAAVAGVTVAVGLVVAPTTTASTPASAGAAAASKPAPAPVALGQAPDLAAPLAAASEFARAWAVKDKKEPRQVWLGHLEPLATQELLAGLRLTDPAARVVAAVSGHPRARYVSDTSALVAVPLSTGNKILVTVVATKAGWRASDVQPDQGN